jgi:serine/threonine protein kinase
MIGRTISHYRVTGKLGVGGMGVVYEAEDTRLARRVALKFLPEELAGDPDSTRRLQREAQTIAVLNHPHICTIYEVDQDGSSVFLVMERVDGMNLKLHMARHILTTREVTDVAMQVADALGAAHAAGIVHRDIKPGNIIVTATGLGGSTIPGRPLGTANYMAPERILQLPLDPRSDLFSLGVVIYEMATGRLPFGGASPAETVTNVLEKNPVPLTQLAPDRPIQLERIVNKLLAKMAGDRYQSATELRDALTTVIRPARRWLWFRG